MGKSRQAILCLQSIFYKMNILEVKEGVGPDLGLDPIARVTIRLGL